MSLTSILENSKELRDKFKKEFLRPPFNLKTELKVSPLTNNTSLVGTAFDYLLRFKVEYINKKTLVQKRDWFADYSYKELLKEFHEHISTRSKRVWVEYPRKIYRAKDLIGPLNVLYEQAKVKYSKFILDGQIIDELISNTIFLAKLDTYGRKGIVIPNFESNPEDIKDLRALISLVDNKLFIAKQKCYLNPSFGKSSELIGADADIIIDNTLIDIKVVKDLQLKTKYLNQILGYYILSLIGGVNENSKDRPIENMGIYFARHGELWTIPVICFGSKSKFQTIKKWFFAYVEENYPVEE